MLVRMDISPSSPQPIRMSIAKEKDLLVRVTLEVRGVVTSGIVGSPGTELEFAL